MATADQNVQMGPQLRHTLQQRASCQTHILAANGSSSRFCRTNKIFKQSNPGKMVQFLLLGVAELVSLLLLVPSINAKGHADCCPVTTFLTWVLRRGQYQHFMPAMVIKRNLLSELKKEYLFRLSRSQRQMASQAISDLCKDLLQFPLFASKNIIAMFY